MNIASPAKKKVLIFCIAIFCFTPIFIRAQQQIDISVTARVCSTSTCQTSEPTPIPWGGGPYHPHTPHTQMIFRGQAYPVANITILKNDTVIATFKARANGYFEKEINGVQSGTSLFKIYAEDRAGRISPTIIVTIPVIADQTTLISRIFIPPTIEINPASAISGQEINIFGESFPESEISIFLMPKNLLLTTTSTKNGEWVYSLDTTNFASNDYTIQAKTIDKDGNQSAFSKMLTFSIIKPLCQGADLNFDGRVNLVDFSILLYFWGQTNPANPCADINSDGIVDIIGFSIMMYYWNE